MATLNKNVELEFAKVASLDPAMDAAASTFQGLVRAEVKKRTGAFDSSIHTRRVRTRLGVTDRIVYSDDPQAHIIEWGFMAQDGTWVPGHFAFSRSLMRMRF